jgi:hypothetical protein
VAASDPPFKGVLDIFGRFSKVLSQLAGTRPSLFSHGDVGESRKVIVTVVLRNQLVLEFTRPRLSTYGCRGHVEVCADHIPFPLISSSIYSVDQIFGIVDPFFFPFLLSEVFELESRMKD